MASKTSSKAAPAPKSAPAPKTSSAPASVNYGYTAAAPSFTYSPPVVTPATQAQVATFTAAENANAGLTGTNTITAPVSTNTVKNANGTSTITYSDGSTQIVGTPTSSSTGSTTSSTTSSTAQQDAYTLITENVASWFGGNTTWQQQAAAFIKDQMLNNVGAETALVNMRQQGFYQQRFSGNATRVANGLNALTEAAYIGLENQYSNLMQSYGVRGLANQAQFATLIGNDVSNTELNSRLDLAVTQVQQADPQVMATLKQFYPTVSTGDLVSYFLAPAETLPQLQRQVQTAEIGAAATKQGLTTSQSSAAALAAYGVTQAQAQSGYGKIAEVLPAATKLSQIYGGQTGINYDQTEAEKQYLMNSGTAALEQQKLSAAEQAQFAGRSGIVGANAAAGYSGSLGKSMQGKF